MLKRIVARLLAAVGLCVALGFLALDVVAPSLQWSATATPGALEKSVAGFVLHRWIHRNAEVQNNPLSLTEENLKAGQRQFNEHCAVCHGADGGAHDWLGADFYPPVARLQKGAPGWTDGELYFLITNGIRYTGMPGFGPYHKAQTIWQIILWVRHLPHLSAEEKAQVQLERQLNEHQEGGSEHK